MPSITLTKSNVVAYDTNVVESAPTTNYGTSTAIGPAAGSGTKQRTLLFFDLGLIPNNAIINSATLGIYQYGSAGATSNVNVHLVTSAWTSGGATWSNQPTYLSSLVSTLSIDASVGYKNFDVKNLVQALVNGDYTNNGFLMKLADETPSSVSKAMYSFDNASNNPTLTIDYTIPSTGKKQVEFVGQGSITNASATSITLPLPASAQVGDLLVAQIYNNNDSYTISAPPGWTILQSAAGSAGGHRFSLAFKVMAIGETQPNFSVSAPVNWTGLISAFRNVKSVAASNIRGMAASTSASPAATSVTAVNTLFAVFNFTANPSATITPPPSYNEDFEIAGTSAKVQMMRRYMYNNKSQTSADMTSALSTNTYYGSGVLALEPLTNNPPTLALTSPTDNQVLSEGQTVLLSTNADFVLQITADDADAADTLQYSVELRGSVVQAYTNCAKGAPFNYTIPYSSLLLGNNAVTVKAKDNNGAEKVFSFTLRNKVPTSISQQSVYEVLNSMGYTTVSYASLQGLKPSGYTSSTLSLSEIINFLT